MSEVKTCAFTSINKSIAATDVTGMLSFNLSLRLHCCATILRDFGDIRSNFFRDRFLIFSIVEFKYITTAAVYTI